MNTIPQPAARKSVVKKIAKIAGIAIGAIILLLVIAVAIGPYLIPTSAVERIISDNTQKDLGRPAKIDDVSMSLIAGMKMTVTNLEISDKPEYGERPLLKVGRVVLDADILPLLGKRRLVVNKLSIEKPELSVVKGKDGRYNFMDVPPRPPEKPEKPDERKPEEPLELPSVKIGSFSLNDGSLTLTDLATQETQKIGNIAAELTAEADPSRKQADIEKASFSFDGFSASAKGKVEQQNGATVLKDLRLDSSIDLTKLGPRFAAVLPVNMAGSSEYHASLDGPITAVNTKVDFTLSGFELSGAKLRKPARIDKLEAHKTAVLNLEQMTAPSFTSETKSDSLGIELKVSGKMGNIRRGGAVNVAMSGKADLRKLADFANSFTPKPVRAEGVATGEGNIVGDPSRELVAKGKGEIANLLFDAGGMPKPYTEERVSLAYDVTARERKSLAIKEFSLNSKLASAQASGTVSADAADLKGSAQADLSEASTLLAGMGLLPEGTSFGGKLAADVGAVKGAAGIVARLESTIRNFFVVSPMLKERYSEEQVQANVTAQAEFADGELDVIRNTQFALKSKLADVSGTVSPVQLAKPAEVKMDATVNADLGPIGELLVVMGYLEKGTTMKGRAEGTFAVALRPEKKEEGAKRETQRRTSTAALSSPPAPSPRVERGKRASHPVPTVQTNPTAQANRTPQGDVAFAGNDPVVLGVLAGAGIQGAVPAQGPQADEQPLLPEFANRILLTGTAKSDGIDFNEIHIDKADAKVRLERRVLSLDGHALLYKGRADVKDESNLGKAPADHKLSLAMRDVFLTGGISALIKKAVPFLSLPLGEIEGKFDADAELTGQGTDKQAFLKTTNGSGKLTMPENARVRLPDYLRLPPAYSNLAFGKMDSTFRIRNGLMNSDTVFTAPDLTLKLAGTTQLPDPQNIEYHIFITGARVGKDLKKLLSKDGESPVGISGTLTQPKPKVYFRNLLGPRQEWLR